MGPATLARLLALSALSIGSFASPAQELWDGMDRYLTVQTTPIPALINHYNSPLVAVYWDYPCANEHESSSGYSDAALTFAKPAQPEEPFRISGPLPGCPGRILGAIWADGKELGDRAVLARAHKCRSVTWEELHRTLKEDVFSVPPEHWDPRTTAELLKRRHAPYEGTVQLGPNDSESAISCRANAILQIAQDIEDYRTAIASKPEEAIRRRGLFLQYLKEWEASLTSSTFPAQPFWWNW